MIIHIGNNNYIYKEDIVAILDRDSVTSGESKSFIEGLMDKKKLIGPMDSKVKSYIIVVRDNRTSVYTSNISSKALINRNF